MAKIIGMEKQIDSSKITLELTDGEMNNLDLNDPVIVFNKKKLELKSTTHKVANQGGSYSVYALLPSGLKKLSKKIPLKEKQQFKCGLIETAEGGYIIFQYEN